MFSKYRSVCVCLTALFLACASTAGASGFSFNPNPLTYPDIFTNANDIDYNSGSGLLTVCGNASAIRLSAVAADNHPMTLTGLSGCAGNYFLRANINSAGVFSGGNLTVTGGVPALGIADATTLLLGTLTAFEFLPYDSNENAPAVFRFLATLTSSDPSLGFGPFAGVEINTNNVTATSFFSSFNNKTGLADTFAQQQPVPEPASLMLFGTGGLVLLLRRRMSRKRALGRLERGALESPAAP